MSNTLSPQQVLLQLEDQKSDELSVKLAALSKRRAALTGEVEDADARIAEVARQREQLSWEPVTALQLSSLEAERQQEQSRKLRLLQELEMIAVEENELRVEIMVCLSKSRAYTKLLEKEKKLQQKHASRVEQQSIDDLMAHRRIREDQL